jgi:hypothetical protein
LKQYYKRNPQATKDIRIGWMVELVPFAYQGFWMASKTPDEGFGFYGHKVSSIFPIMRKMDLVFGHKGSYFPN